MLCSEICRAAEMQENGIVRSRQKIIIVFVIHRQRSCLAFKNVIFNVKTASQITKNDVLKKNSSLLQSFFGFLKISLYEASFIFPPLDVTAIFCKMPVIFACFNCRSITVTFFELHTNIVKFSYELITFMHQTLPNIFEQFSIF